MQSAYLARNIVLTLYVLIIALFIVTLLKRKQSKKIRRTFFFVAIPLLVLFTGYLVFTQANPFFRVDGPYAKVITHNVMDLDDINYISRFRSSAGHDYPANGESCRTMKTYIQTVVEGVKQNSSGQLEFSDESKKGLYNMPVYAPFDGWVTVVLERGTVYAEIRIQSSHSPFTSVKLQHVDAIDGIKSGTRVKSGQRVGYPAQAIDPTYLGGIDVSISEGGDFFSFGPYDNGWLVPYFEALSDEAFKPWANRGFKRSDFMISKAYRDAHPLQCEGQKYANVGKTDEDMSRVKISEYKLTSVQ